MNKLMLGLALILFIAGAAFITTASVTTLSGEEIAIKHYSTGEMDKRDMFYYRYNTEIIAAPSLQLWRWMASHHHLNQTEIDRIVNIFKQLARNETQSLAGIEGYIMHSPPSIRFKIFDLETESIIDADIYVDGNKYTTSRIELSPGEHTFQIKKEGYYDTGIRTIKVNCLTYVAVTMIPSSSQHPEFSINPIGMLLMLSAIPIGVYGWKHE